MNSPSNKNTPQKAKKPPEIKNSPSINSKDFDQKIKRLTSRLSRQNICKQHKLIANMNMKLQVPMEHMLKLEEFKNLKLDDAVRLIKNVPFLEWVNEKYSFRQIQSSDKVNLGNGKHSMASQHYALDGKQLIRLKYPNSEKIIILTGIHKAWVDTAIRDFSQHSGQQQFIRSHSYKKTPSVHHHSICEIIGTNDFWIAVQADTVVNALTFKKFIRQRKKAYEENRDYSFKEDKKRVRIVMQNQDFYTLLVDAMTQKKNIEFTKRLVIPNSGMFPSMCLREMKKVAAFPNEEYQMSLKKINRVLYFPIIINRPQIKQSEQHFTLEDFYSQDLSKRSDMLDSINSMNDLIEKADQGTQAESFGIGTHDHEISSGNLLNGNESYSLGSVKEVSPKKSNRSFGNQQLMSIKENSKCEVEQLSIQKKVEKSQQKPQDDSQSDLDSVTEVQINSNQGKSQVTNLQPIIQVEENKNWHKLGQTVTDHKKIEENGFGQMNTLQLNPVSLFSVRQPQVPAKMLKFSFSVSSQTQPVEINYTKMKRLEAEYQKKSINRFKLAPGIPEEFRQVSYEMRNKELFVQNILKSMEKSSQKKQFALEY